MLKIFRDEKNQNEFEKSGIVILPCYNELRLRIRSTYSRLHTKDEKGFFPGTFSHDKQYRNEADAEIKRIGNFSIEKYCCDVKVVCGSFIVKNPGPESGMYVHQDMSLVGEAFYRGKYLGTVK
jgi:hypothetical protein